MSQKQRKDKISDWLTLALGKLSGGALLVAFFVGLPVYGLWYLTGTLEYQVLRWAAVAVVVVLPLAFIAGFYFGKVEVRGFLGGVDVSLDKLAKAVDLRDKSRVTMHNATRKAPAQPKPNMNVFLPQPGALPSVPVSHKQLIDGDVIDL